MVVLVRIRVDDDMHIGGARGSYAPGTRTYMVRRGMEGTTAAAHDAGAEVLFLPAFIPADVAEEFSVDYLPTAQVRNPRYKYPKGRS